MGASVSRVYSRYEALMKGREKTGVGPERPPLDWAPGACLADSARPRTKD